MTTEKVSYCFHCGNREVEIVRRSWVQKEGSKITHIVQTNNKTFICTNPECIMRINLSKVKTWEKV